MSHRKFRKTIVSVELIKFMCHDHLLISLRKPLTIVSGCNGSGKSAIMVAIGLVFGQRASHLERGSSFKDLIKSKESNAAVRIVLENHRGFRKEFFGETIIIEKRIGMKSATTSIMNGERRVWSTRREDLETVLEFFALRFENPLNFLTQEQAKRFLSTMDPEMLYELFMQGTEIAEICRLNSESMSNVEAMRRRISLVAEELDGIEKRIKDEEGVLDAINNAKDMEKTILCLEDEMVWARVNEKRMQMEKCFERFRDKQEEMDKYNERLEELSQAIGEARKRMNSIEAEEGERKRNGDRRSEEIDGMISRLRMRRREICNDSEELKEARDFKKKIVSDFEKQDGTVKSLLPQLEDKHKRIASEVETLQGVLERLGDESRECREKAKVEEEAASEREGRILHLRKQIEFYSKNDQNSFFGPSFPAAMDEISRTKFNGEVVGPIAFEVKVKEERWSKAISIVLNNSLSTFIVTNRVDKDALLRIFRRHKVDFPISTLSSRVPEVIKYKANPRYTSVLDALEVKNPFVMNYLIITTSIEQTILVESRKEAYEIIRSRPAFVECAYTRNGDKIRLVGGSMSDFVTRGVDRFYFENAHEKLERCRAEMKRLAEEGVERRWERRLKEIKNEMDKVSEDIESRNRMQKALRVEMDHERHIHDTQMEIMKNDDLYEEIRSLTHQISLLEKKQSEISEEIEVLEREKKEIREYKGADTGRLRQEISRNTAEASEVRRRIDMWRTDILKLKEEHQKQVELYNSEKSLALESGKKEMEARAEDEIKREIAYIKAQAEMCRGIGDEEKALGTLEHLKRMRRGKEDLLREYDEKIRTALEGIESRIVKRDSMRNEIARRAAEEFSRLTKARGYEGALEFDHQKKRLDVQLRVHGQSEVGSRSMLSGGERSFASVSLLLSLWPSLSCPIKVLDEFDVFMDNLNRKHAIRQLLGFFKENGFQGILITPLSIEDLFEDFCDVVVLDKAGRDEHIER
ncbi:structural maintenance of chromosomes protein [Encephalitozoon cuniculi]|uniref:Rad18-like recombination and DNA repair protein n=1 Tax=Encephalitozoon cuniculi TaxID=6035 RepID=M1K5R5_ENCCN|nr:rad18-like recombination and DNA repair protein [Encephalitozoon cuniculi]UYI27196.1 structural maintenance of chromosomes protein [Encephalitozoon cuniculi]